MSGKCEMWLPYFIYKLKHTRKIVVTTDILSKRVGRILKICALNVVEW
jgi:hypothetical protein